MIRYLVTIVTCGMLIGLVTTLHAGEYNRVLSVGDQAPQWKNLSATSGKTHSFKQLDDAKAIVVVFTCNSCPYAVDVEDRLLDLHADYHRQGVAIVAINVNKVPEDSFEAMKEKTREKSFQFAYLFDPSQQIAKDYGAKYTPEFFVINRDRKIAYMGSLDDSPDGQDVKRRYVREALQRCLASPTDNLETMEVTQETVPIGCRIRFERQRRKRRGK